MNNPQPHPPQSGQARTRLDEIRELAELSNTIDPSLHTDVMYALAYHVPALYALALACRDAQGSLEEVGYPIILEALAPLLERVRE